MPKAAQADLSEFEAMSRTSPGLCVVARTLTALDADDRKKCEAALAAEHISNLSIVKWLRQPPRELRVSDDSVKKHRRGGCCCA